MIILYIIVLIFFIWLLIGASMILIKIVLALFEFYEDIKQIKKRGK